MQRSDSDYFMTDADSSNDKSYVMGDTVMHYAARHATSVANFEMLISHLEEHDRIDSVLSFNDNKETVFDVINEQLTSEQQEELKKHLLHYALKRKIKPLTEKISFEAVEKQYGLIPGTKRHQNFKAAVNIINTIRDLPRFTSLSHPDVNGMEFDSIDNADETLYAHRHNYTQRMMDHYLKSKIVVESSTPNSINFAINMTDQERRQMEGLGNHFLYTGLANCEELARAAYILGDKSGLTMTNYEIFEGDHVVTKIGEGADAVFCDVWSGTVFDDPTKIGTYYSITVQNKVYNLVMNLNLNYQKVAEYHFYGMSQDLTITITFTNDFADKIVRPLVEKASSDKEKFLFAAVIRRNLEYAIENNLIHQNVIYDWLFNDDLSKKLKEYFSSDINYIPTLIQLYGECEQLLSDKLRLALANRADPNLATNEGETPLLFATMKGYTNIVKMLLDAGANQNCTYDFDGKTPLMIAIIQENEAIVDCLLAEANTNLGVNYYTSDYLRDCAKCVSIEAYQRMQNYIHDASAYQNANLSSIPITPYDFAFIMGYDSIASKLNNYATTHVQFAHLSKLSASPCALFTPGQSMKEEVMDQQDNMELCHDTYPRTFRIQ